MSGVAAKRTIDYLVNDEAENGSVVITYIDVDKTFTEKYSRALIQKDFREKTCDDHKNVRLVLTSPVSAYDALVGEFYMVFKMTFKGDL